MRAVIAGRLLKRGDIVSLGVELVDVEDGAQLWSGYYNRNLTDIFAMQDQIATEISDKLRVRLTGNQRKRLTKRHTQNTEAYQLYLKGRFHLARRTEESFKNSFEYFQQSVERDPGYALAYAGLADAYFLAQLYSVIAPAVGLPKARAAVARALELDESLAEAHTTLGVIRSAQDWDVEAGEKEFRRAIELNPNYSTAFLWYGMMHLLPLGQFGEAEAALKRALEVDPFSLIINTHLGTRPTSYPTRTLRAKPLPGLRACRSLFWIFPSRSKSLRTFMSALGDLSRRGRSPALSFCDPMDSMSAFQPDPLPSFISPHNS